MAARGVVTNEELTLIIDVLIVASLVGPSIPRIRP